MAVRGANPKVLRNLTLYGITRLFWGEKGAVSAEGEKPCGVRTVPLVITGTGIGGTLAKSLTSDSIGTKKKTPRGKEEGFQEGRRGVGRRRGAMPFSLKGRQVGRGGEQDHRVAQKCLGGKKGRPERRLTRGRSSQN